MKKNKLEKFTIGDFFLHAFMIALSLFCLYPFLVTFMASISSEQSIINNGYQLIPEEFSTLAYETVFKDGSVFNGYAVTIFITVVGTLLSLFVTALAGYAMSVNKVRYRNVASMYFYIPTVFSAGLVPWYLVCTQTLHLQNSIWALILPSLVSTFNIFLMRNYFKTIPSALIEAAEIDGCGPFRTAMVVVLPLSKPIIATITRFVGLGYWNNWSNARYFRDGQSLCPLQ